MPSICSAVLLFLALVLAGCPGSGEDGDLAAAVSLERVFGRAAERVEPSLVGITAFAPGADPRVGQPESGWRVAGARFYAGHRALATRSGFLVSEDGFILTSHHGLLGEDGAVADVIEVEFQDHRLEHARLVGAEPTLDLAVLKVDVEGPLPAAPLADPERALQVGQWALAVGDPPGPGRVLAAGTIGAPPSRECYQEELTATLIQSSARVPPEAWGGPMLDVRGDVIGISLPRSASRDARGADAVGLALPIGLALTLYEPLVVRERSESPWLGVSVEHVGREWRLARERAGLPARGIRIDDVFDPSPASRAGVQPGDVLSEMGGEATGSVAEFQRQLYLLGVGAPVELVLYRGHNTLRRSTVLEARPENATQR